MRRGMKLGIYGAVLVGLVGGCVAWTAVDKTVTLKVDGQTRKIHTVADTVDGALASAGYKIASHDVVAPDANDSISNGQTVILKRGRLLHLTIDGTSRDIWVTAPTVADALAELGYSSSSFASVSRDKRLPLDPTTITMRTPKDVTITVAGQPMQVKTTQATVAGLLSQYDIALGPQDQVSVPLTSAPVEGEQILVQRVTTGVIKSTVPVPFGVTSTKDSTLAQGNLKITQAGKPGTATVTYSVVYLDGVIVGRSAQSKTVTSAPVDQVQVVGTRNPAADAAAAAAAAEAAAADAAVAATVTPGSAKAIAQKLLAARGMGDDQFACLVKLWSRESGWRVNASNSSGAYGIPQALPGSKMAAFGSDWRTNPATQIQWGLSYITGRYDTPCGAWGHSQSTGWY
ncbi:Uncharacterized conserved protein YabE, contains G5 and tandem DUF348 domains [Frankineae bacterium MT45]|nr:Uncharacterized conserved protein YabE, contains G5 and tandem DUF348 domains [Frankineae bacterium MT45]